MNVDEASAALQALQGKKLGNMAIKINFGKVTRKFHEISSKST